MAMVLVDSSKIIRITSNDGGYMGGECLACGKSGYLREGYSYPFGSTGYRGKGLLGNELVHAKNCPLNKHLNKDGTRRESY